MTWDRGSPCTPSDWQTACAHEIRHQGKVLPVRSVCLALPLASSDQTGAFACVGLLDARIA